MTDRKARLRVSATVVAGLIAVSLMAIPPSALAEDGKRSAFYLVVAHPDDEGSVWSYLQQLPTDTYLISILMTRGEATDSCLSPQDANSQARSDALEPTHFGTFVNNIVGGNLTATPEESSGPYKYEGPDSPVGEPDKKERHPLGNPWVGQFSEACAEARVASWHWFLDQQFRNDGIGTDLAVENDPELDDDYQGMFCEPGHQGNGLGRPTEKQVGCAWVWADERGARVVFDLGDQGWVDGAFLPTRFTPEQVTTALQMARENRLDWGIPALPEAGVVSGSRYGDGESCPRFSGTDHDVVNQAIRYMEQGLPLRAGVMGCETDDLGQGASVRTLVESPTSLILWNLLNPVTEERMGAFVVNYGWLFPDYVFAGCPVCYFWEVRS